MNDTLCWPCRSGNHNACILEYVEYSDCNCDHTSAPTAALGSIGAAIAAEDALAALVEGEDSGLSESENSKSGFSRRLKDEASLIDAQSTGRKRAAALFPLKDKDGKPIPCDFANQQQCLPNFMEVQIDGCGIRKGTLPGIAQARHHHNYDVLNNERSNVGLLCHSCHNLLHSRNDPFKDKIYERIYGFRPTLEDLSHAAKSLKSGVVNGGQLAE